MNTAFIMFQITRDKLKDGFRNHIYKSDMVDFIATT